MGDNKYKAEDAMRLNEAVERLQEIVDELKQGKLVLAAEGESILVEPEDAVKLEVEFERKKGKEELEIELSWKRAGAAAGEDDEEEDEDDEEDEEEKIAMTEECAACPMHGEERGHRHPLTRFLPLAVLALTAAIIAIALKDGIPQRVLDLRDRLLKRAVEEEEEGEEEQLPRQEAEGRYQFRRIASRLKSSGMSSMA
jgi:amphi-Trp domain-containing protein